jgi:hypothetical protein
MATLRMPDRLARELVAYCITETAPTSRSDDLLRMLISALGDIRVESAHIATDAKSCRRHANVEVDPEDARAFQALFPGAARLRGSPRGASVFRLDGRQRPQTAVVGR